MNCDISARATLQVLLYIKVTCTNVKLPSTDIGCVAPVLIRESRRFEGTSLWPGSAQRPAEGDPGAFRHMLLKLQRLGCKPSYVEAKIKYVFFVLVRIPKLKEENGPQSIYIIDIDSSSYLFVCLKIRSSY